MRLPGWLALACVGSAALAVADPKPADAPAKVEEIDSRGFRDRALVFQDAQGGTYVVLRDNDARLFYGSGKLLYEQWVLGSSANGDAWSVDTWAPRLQDMHRGAVQRKDDGTYVRSCDREDDAGLTLLSADRTKAVLASVKLVKGFDRRAFLLARDDAGVYYYVDHLWRAQGYRVFVGKKGAMKQVPLTDVAIDSAGAVFSTKTGDLRLVTASDTADGKRKVKWVHGDKGEELHFLDTDVESQLIYKDLGVYGFLGTLCDNV